MPEPEPTEREAFERVVGAMRDAMPDADLVPVEAAFDALCQQVAPVGRERALRCAERLVTLGLGPPALAACLAASVDVEDETLREQLGPEVTAMVDGVGRLRAMHWDALGKETPESLRRMFMAMAADVRVVMLLLADRVEVMRGLRDLDDTEHRQRLARETLEVFAPLANRLGIFQLKWELEDLAMRELEPQIYQQMKRDLAQTRRDRDAQVREVMGTLERELRAQGVHFRITGRPKHIYSIYNKMKRKGVPLAEIFDQIAVRVIVQEVRECYAVLGVVHGLYTPIPQEFDDYIARPKQNMYRSLHTAVVGPGGRPVEIQIRTEEMHRFAEYGVAAHWAYKEGGSASGKGDEVFNLIRQLMEWQKQVADPELLAETLKADIFQDRVYVFTPAGDVVDLPAGATPLDFAYRVHTMVGHRCRGARINGKIVSLDTALQTGDRVEILTRKSPEPSRDWLNPHLGYLQTSTAKQKVRTWFRQQGRDEAIAQGREIVAREFARLGVAEPPTIDQLVAEQSTYHKPEDLLAALGFGDLNVQGLAARTLEKIAPPPPPDPAPDTGPDPGASRGPRRAAGGVSIDGFGDVMSTAARCCHPVPGDDVVGFVSRGRGILIHRRDCPNILHSSEPERIFEIDWGREKGSRYPVTVEVDVVDAPGVFRDVAEVVSAMGVNLESVQTRRRPKEHTGTITMKLDVESSAQVVTVLSRLERLARVIAARRRAD